MRRFLPGLALAVFAGCNAQGSDDALLAPTALAAAATAVYPENGHPVSLDTADGAVLSRESELEALTNDYRVALGLPALAPREGVRAVARAHSEHMIGHAFFAHLNPEGDDPRGRADRVRVTADWYGENIAAGHATASEAFVALLASPSHRANLERAEWAGQGAGYAYGPGSEYLHYWTQNFVAP